MKKSITRLMLLFVLQSITLTLIAQENYTPSKENLAAREQFQDNKFGIFIHWGLYAMMGQGEWVMHNRDIDYAEYEKLADAFYPSKFNADEWVKAIKNSGAKYICITTRHHDGFSMFHTAQSPYNIVDATPFGRDIIKELADACHRHGIALHFYYSHLDWRRNDYTPLGRTGHGTHRRLDGKWESYLDFMKNQLTELLTNYGKIGAIWFDGLWDRDEEEGGMKPERWDLYTQYELIHTLQPSCLVANNHHSDIIPGEDIQIFERDIPGQNLYGYSEQAISRLPLETCQTMNKTWGYNITDSAYKSSKFLIQYLVKTAGKGANLLLNIGPQPNGELPEEAIKRLNEMGAWMKTYGETIYGTRGGVVPPSEWGVTTQKRKKLFVHVLEPYSTIFLPYQNNKLLKANAFVDGKPVKFNQVKEGIILNLGKTQNDTIDYVVELEFKNEIK
ncbi:MAG: alpha-L-fucosidase [Bacteroidales bacterium]|nr:alpha-L-fucosidase [Bacteroidales bacterium]